MGQQCQHPIADQVISSVMSGCNQQEGHRYNFSCRDLFALGFCPNEPAYQGIVGHRAFVFDQGKQISVEVLGHSANVLGSDWYAQDLEDNSEWKDCCKLFDQ